MVTKDGLHLNIMLSIFNMFSFLYNIKMVNREYTKSIKLYL